MRNLFKNLLNKLNSSQYMLNCTNEILPTFSKILLLNAHVLLHCMYGALLRGPVFNNTQLKKLDKRLNNMLLNIKNVKRVRNYNLLYKELMVLNINDLIKFVQSKFIQNHK